MMKRAFRPLAAVALSTVSQQLRFQATDAKAAPAAEAKPAAPAKPAVPSAPKVANDFTKILGTQCRIWETHKCGDHVYIHVDSNMFGWIIMDTKGGSANSLNEEFMKCLEQALDLTDKLIKDKKIYVAIITSAKDTFCVGADINKLYPVTEPKEAEKVSREAQKFFQRIQDTKYPIVAAINGLAFGGGCELALACHHRVISSTASMGLPETMLGLLPGAGGTVRLQKFIGIQNALQWILKGSPVKADKCKKQGAVDRVVPGKDRFPGEYCFFEGVRSFAGTLADKPLKPAKGKPKSLVNKILEDTPFGRNIILSQSVKMLDKMTKGKYQGQYYALECVLHAAAAGPQSGFEREATNFGKLMVMPEAKNQIAIYFLDDGMKKVDKKTGVTKDKIMQLKAPGVIGAGVMGAGIAQFFAAKGFKTAMKDIDDTRVKAGMDFVKGEFETVKKKRKHDNKWLEKQVNMVVGGTSDDIFKNCDILVECAVEVMETKKMLLKQLEDKGVLDGKKIFATNTSSLSLTELQTASKYPETIVGMHFFNPVAKMPLVEVIKGKKTTQEIAAAVFQLALKTGKKPIIVNDGPGFLVNRILVACGAEAARCSVVDRAEPMRVDQALVNFGLPMGPFRLLDEVGLDIATHVAPVLEKGIKNGARFALPPCFDQMVKDGFLGKKNKKGVYRYDEKGKDLGMDTTVAAKYLQGSPDSTFSTVDIVDRCILMMVNEGAMILQEEIASCPEDVDIGMIFGAGFAPFRGGLMQYADHRGIQKIVDRLNELQNKLKDDRFAPCQLITDMGKSGKRFFPDRPYVPYVERVGSYKPKP